MSDGIYLWPQITALSIGTTRKQQNFWRAQQQAVLGQAEAVHSTK